MCPIFLGKKQQPIGSSSFSLLKWPELSGRGFQTRPCLSGFAGLKTNSYPSNIIKLNITRFRSIYIDLENDFHG